MNLIVTMNAGGDYIPPNAMRSHLHAATRWNAIYMQWTQKSNCLLVKMGALAGHFGGSRVLWLDGDTIIRDDCPSPFELVPIDKVGAVQNDQGDTHNAEHLGVHESSWKYSREVLGMTGEDSDFDQAMYINTGVVVSTPELHAPLFDAAFHAIKAMPPDRQWEKDQSLVSILCKASKCLYLLPHAFNRLGPSVAKSMTTMPAFIQHYAPIGDFRPDKHKHLSLTNWQTGTAAEVDMRCTVVDPAMQRHMAIKESVPDALQPMGA